LFSDKLGATAVALQHDLISDLVPPCDVVNAVDVSHVKTATFSFLLHVRRASFAAVNMQTLEMLLFGAKCKMWTAPGSGTKPRFVAAFPILL